MLLLVGLSSWRLGNAGAFLAPLCGSSDTLVASAWNIPKHRPSTFYLSAGSSVSSTLDMRTADGNCTKAANTPRDEQRVDWIGRVQQLYEYSIQHGNTLVPKRYGTNPGLGNWVSKQRQQYRRFRQGCNPCSLTKERIEILEHVGFCWNAKGYVTTRSEIEDEWWEKLWAIEASSSFALVETQLDSTLNAWLRQQRKARRNGKLDDRKSQALDEMLPNWHMSIRERQWECRFQDLKRYQTDHGDCLVPISFANKKLANWVSNQRKQYNLRKAGERSDMTEEREARLTAIGFVWNRWDCSWGVNDGATFDEN